MKTFIDFIFELKRNVNLLRVMGKHQHDTIDKILLTLQLLAFSVGVILNFPQNIDDNTSLLVMSILFIVSCLIKIVREIRNKNVKNLLKAQISYLLIYLLTVFLLVFGYQAYTNAQLGTEYIVLSILNIASNNICYSMVIYPELQSLAEFIVYFIGQGITVSYAVSDTISFVYEFDTLDIPDGAPESLKQMADEAKDFILLVMATYIALGLIILDLLMRAL